VVDGWLRQGGRLLVLDGPHFDAKVTRFADMGLEEVLEKWGVALKHAIVVDEPRLRGSAVAFAVSEGYGDHPITGRLMHQRTLWATVREVRGVSRPGLLVKEIVQTSDAGWGETDLGIFHATADLSFDPKQDVKGPVPIGVAVENHAVDSVKGARIVALGSAELAGSREVLGYNRDLLLSSVAWLVEAAPRIAVGPRTPEHQRLTLDDRQLGRVFLYAVIALPLLVLLFGAGVYWVRRS
jgi:ABC-type uncharacterized transport system involved in gliding motility auxiliary subunit